MGVLAKIAYRNLREHKTKTIIIGSLITLGLMVLVVGNSVLDTATEGIKSNYTENYTGHIIVASSDVESPSLTPDGAVPPDNPDPDSPVYSSGHRNVQGIAWDAEGNLWASEFGAQTWDELNLIRPGSDYGWPTHEGTGGEGSGFVDPVQQWPTDQASPSGIAVADGTVFIASLRGQRLWAVPVGAGKAGDPQAFFSTELGRLRTVAEAPDGSLWLITNNTDGRGSPRPGDDRILRLSLR